MDCMTSMMCGGFKLAATARHVGCGAGSHLCAISFIMAGTLQHRIYPTSRFLGLGFQREGYASGIQEHLGVFLELIPHRSFDSSFQTPILIAQYNLQKLRRNFGQSSM